MASKPYFSRHRNQWVIKYKPSPTGPWVEAPLGKHSAPVPPGKPVPKKPPIHVVDRAKEYADIEYNAATGIGKGPQRAKPLAAYLAAFLDGYESTHDAGSVKQAHRHVKSFAEFCAERGVTTVQGVNKEVCREYLKARAKVASAATLKTEKGYLSPIWTQAVDDELMEANPWSRVKPPGKIADPEPTFWNSGEIAAIVDAARKPWQKDLILVLANTGIRISATLAMEWSWINWGGFEGKGAITVPREHDKGGFGYTQTMEEGARLVLQRRHVASTSKLIFPHWKDESRPITYDTANDMIAKAVMRAGVKAGTPHDFRHSYGRALERAGKPMSIIQRQLGHRSPSMTEKYTSASEDETGQWVGSLNLGSPTPPDPRS